MAANAGRSFQGPIPAGSFYLEPEEAEALLARGDADYGQVVRPYLIGDDITEEVRQRPRRFVIDFGFRPLEEAVLFPAALELVRKRVKPERDRLRAPARRGSVAPSRRAAWRARSSGCSGLWLAGFDRERPA